MTLNDLKKDIFLHGIYIFLNFWTYKNNVILIDAKRSICFYWENSALLLSCSPQGFALYPSNDYLYFTEHLKFVSDHLETQVANVINIELPEWIFDPFINNVDQVMNASSCEECLILVHYNEAKTEEKQGYYVIWIYKYIATMYLKMRLKVELLFVSFLLSDLEETLFSRVYNILTKIIKLPQCYGKGNLTSPIRKRLSEWFSLR